MDTIIKTLENHKERLNKQDVEIAKIKKDIAKLKKDVVNLKKELSYLKNELKREISGFKRSQKETEDLIFRLVKAVYENDNTFEDDNDLFMIALLMKN